MKNLALQTIDTEIKGLELLKTLIDDTFNVVVERIAGIKGHVVFSGLGKNTHICCKIAASLSSTGTPAIFIHPSEAQHGDVGMLSENDILIVVSNSGETTDLFEIINYAKLLNIKIIAITSVPHSSISKLADYTLLIPSKDVASEACPFNKTPTTSTTTTLVLGDALTVALMHRKNFQLEQYKIRHPGGKLGYSMRQVKDVMHTGNEIPLVDEKTLIQDAVITMSEKRLGCVGVVNNSGQLVGIVTDGDIRRNMSKDLFLKQVAQIMTKNPKIIDKDKLISEALKTMTTNKITSLFIIDELQKAAGIIHIHQCL